MRCALLLASPVAFANANANNAEHSFNAKRAYAKRANNAEHSYAQCSANGANGAKPAKPKSSADNTDNTNNTNNTDNTDNTRYPINTSTSHTRYPIHTTNGTSVSDLLQRGRLPRAACLSCVAVRWPAVW